MAIQEILSPFVPEPFPLKRRSQDPQENGAPQEQTSPTKAAKTTLTPDLKKVTLSRASAEPLRSRKVLDFAITFEEKVSSCQRVLKTSCDRTNDLSLRLKIWPKRADPSSTSGCYIVTDGSEPIVVVKPASQEAAGRFCPTVGNVKREGFLEGDSAVRERLAWLVQKLLQFDFAIPPTSLETLKHPLFGNLKQVGELLYELSKNHDIDLSYEMLFELTERAADLKQFVEPFTAPKLAPICKELAEKGVPADDIERLKLFCRHKHAGDFKKVLAAQFLNPSWLQEAYCKICRLDKLTKIQAEAEGLLSSLYTAFKEIEHAEETLVSVQQFEANDGSLHDLDNAKKRLIPQEEFYKFLIDILLFNPDRHNGNVLIRKVKLSNGPPSYSLILIDNGLVLPRPLLKKDLVSLKHNSKEWSLECPQASCKIEGKLKQIIEKLDLAGFISALKDELQEEAKRFPQVSSAFDDECFLLLEFNLLLLKRAVSVGATLRDMAAFQFTHKGKAESEMATMLRKVVWQDASGHFFLDKNLATRELELRFE